ncbi:MAG: hypothetical protein IT214_01495 [Chitinophagaceae bacterium]|nr:hypothetical protein [Chitinophagaceae bacterium]
MKKQLLFSFIVTALFSMSSVAQIKKGAIFLGGDIGGSTQKTTYSSSANVNKQSGFYISPVLGKVIEDNLVFGINASVNIFNTKLTGTNNENKQRSYGAGIFIRKYRPVGKSGFSIFAQENLGYSYYKSEVNPLTPGFNSDIRNTISISVSPGISYTLTQRLQLEAGLANILSLNYLTEKQNTGGIFPASSKSNGFSINGSLNGFSSVYVGFRYLLD